MDRSQDIDRILLKYIREEGLSTDETILLQQWLREGEGREEMIGNIKNETGWMQEELKKMQQTPHSRIWDTLSSRLEEGGHWKTANTSTVVRMTRPSGYRKWRFPAAAIIIFAVAGAAFWVHQQHSSVPANGPAQTQTATVSDAKAGTNRATLTLSDGRQINLDSTGNGILASQGNSRVTKLADGQLAYSTASEEKPAAPAFNILSTPRAGQFSLTLPDGSKVWLNNASSLRYPVAFTGGPREVELSGEAYFEITKDAAHPFRVVVPRGPITSTIEVLGTSFNIMAYDDEPAERTTLVEGSVRFVHGGASASLKPDEQLVLDEKGGLKTLHNVNVSEITAWKNGYFHFDHASLETTMRQLARWYDVDVEYSGNIPPQDFMGRIQRNLALSAILKGLENEHVHFKLEGRKLTVKP
ncbi:MAG TPA: FecR domain-containing protein [Puia sp.]|jgi:ferric-dicitrate binding protein FerR (iron transport regulator)